MRAQGVGELANLFESISEQGLKILQDASKQMVYSKGPSLWNPGDIFLMCAWDLCLPHWP